MTAKLDAAFMRVEVIVVVTFLMGLTRFDRHLVERMRYKESAHEQEQQDRDEEWNDRTAAKADWEGLPDEQTLR